VHLWLFCKDEQEGIQLSTFEYQSMTMHSPLPEHEHDFEWMHIGFMGTSKRSSLLMHQSPWEIMLLTLMHYVDVIIMHAMTTKKSVGCYTYIHPPGCSTKHPFIGIPSKKQPTVETATYGSIFVAATRTCVEQIIDLYCTLYSLLYVTKGTGLVTIAVIDSSTNPKAKLHKQHTILSFQHDHEAVASFMVSYLERLIQLISLVSMGDMLRS